MDIRPKAIKITLDKERTLAFDLNTLCELEDRLGGQEQVIELIGGLEKGSYKAVRTMLWAGLLHEDESLDEKVVAGWVTINNFVEISRRVRSAFNEALPQSKN
jgi:hypothetical protein